MRTKEIIERLKGDIKEIDGKLYIEQTKIDDVLMEFNLPAWELDEITKGLERLNIIIVETLSQIQTQSFLDGAIHFFKSLAEYLEANIDDIDNCQIIELKETLNLLLNIINNKTQGKTTENPSARKTITMDMIKYCYIYGKKYYNSEISLEEARGKVVELTAMNEFSARIYINAVKNMLDGYGLYTQAISTSAYEYFFKIILEEYGREKLLKAIKVVESHIDHRKIMYANPQKKLSKLCIKYKS